MNVKQTCFGRHWQHMMVKRTKVNIEDGTNFWITAPKDGYIIKPTAHAFPHNLVSYLYIQQLNNCDACVVTKSFVNSKGHFNATIYLVSYDTVVCEARFLSENRHDKTLPYVEFTFGEHWNHSRTTVQHVYKFLRMFSVYDLHLAHIAKKDKRNNNDTYSYTKYYGINSMNNVYCYNFSSDNAILDFKLNDASRVVRRMIG